MPTSETVPSKAQELDVPVSLHEAYLSGMDTIGLDRMSSYAGCHIVSHVFEQMAAIVNVTLAGIFQRFPRLRVGFLEAGCGWAPTWVDRIEEHYELAPGEGLQDLLSLSGGVLTTAVVDRALIDRIVPFAPPQRLLAPISGAMGFGVPAAVAAGLRARIPL